MSLSWRLVSTALPRTGCRGVATSFSTPLAIPRPAQRLQLNLHLNRSLHVPPRLSALSALSKHLKQNRPAINVDNLRYGTFFSRSYPSTTSAFNTRFFTSNGALKASANVHAQEHAPEPLPTLSPPSVGRWLLLSSLLVYAVIVVGGVTRLTESGLSITEWRPIAGVLPPLSRDEWEEEFTKYKATPEFKLLNSAIALADFKRIFYMEWAHRVLGRVVGLAFVLPLAYYALRRRLAPGLLPRAGAMALLLGAQGALGWYMVQSGLAPALLDTPGAVPRVSQYRLAAHLGAALALYAMMLGTGGAVLRDWTYARAGTWSGVEGRAWEGVVRNPVVRRFRAMSWALTALVLVTALSGAFVAGLDAGLLYNEFPLMGGQLIPPRDELMNPAYATRTDGKDLWWRNMLENPTTTQFDHRVLGVASYVGVGLLHAYALVPSVRSVLPKVTRRLAGAAFGIVNVQVLLGISTLLYLVPVPVAAAHQAGSVALLTSMIALALTLRRPGAVAQVWRKRLASLPRQPS